MKAVKTIAIGAAGLVALVGASAPAAAQYYPGYGGYGGTNVVGQVINSILNPYGGYGQYGYGYGMNPQAAAQQCTAAVQQRLNGRYGAGYGYGYQPYGYNGYGNGRVLGITRIEQRSNGTLRVRGDATSGMAYGGYPYGGYGGYGAYGGGYGGADLEFRCDVDYRGYIRDVDIDRRD